MAVHVVLESVATAAQSEGGETVLTASLLLVLRSNAIEVVGDVATRHTADSIRLGVGGKGGHGGRTA